MDLSQHDWATQLEDDKNAVILDVRTEDEFNDGFIPSAQNIDIYQPQQFMDAVEKLDPSKNYYVYCKSGGRSSQACAVLKQRGIENAYNLEGGFTNWEGDVLHN